MLSCHWVLLSQAYQTRASCNCLMELNVGVMQDWEEGDGDYLAPELLQEASPTPAADIYSLGATLYECATGVG